MRQELRLVAGGLAAAGERERPRTAFVVVDGRPADEWRIDVALVNAGPTDLEVIRPVDGAVDLYRDAVRPGEPVTLHHVGFVVDDFDEASAVVAARPHLEAVRRQRHDPVRLPGHAG